MAEDAPSGPLKDTPSRGRSKSRRRKSGGKRGKVNLFAAIDLGTNNCRLLVAKPLKEGFRVIDAYSNVVRLGEGLAATGNLSDDAMGRAVEAIGKCAEKINRHKVRYHRSIATQACRVAGNGQAFIDRVREETGLRFDIISAKEEAKLAVMGCLNLADTNKDIALVIDIGGGSTELSWVDLGRQRRADAEGRILKRPPIAAWVSIPVGVVTLSEQHPEQEPRSEWYDSMRDHVKQCLADSNSDKRYTKLFQQGRGHLIGTSGTITSLAGVHLGLERYQRNRVDGLWMRSADVVTIARRLGGKSPEERAAEACLDADRARLIVAGCAILDVVCELWPSHGIRVADRGLREGILMGLINRTKKQPRHNKEAQNG